MKDKDFQASEKDFPEDATVEKIKLLNEVRFTMMFAIPATEKEIDDKEAPFIKSDQQTTLHPFWCLEK